MNNLVYYDGKKVKIGDTGIAINGEKIVQFEINENTIPQLLELKIIMKTPTYNKNLPVSELSIGQKIHKRMFEVNMDIDFYLEILLNKMVAKTNTTFDIGKETLLAIKEVNKTGYFVLLLKEVAIELDKSYKNHISKCKTLYTISAKDGKPYYIKEGDLKSINSVALFRTEVDAIVACKILASLKKEVFSGRK